MIQLLLGQDDFTKNQFVLDLAKKLNAQIEYFVALEDLEKFSFAPEKDLFSKPKLSVLRGVFKDLEKKYKGSEVILPENSHILIIEEKLDKRGALAKKLLSDKIVRVQQFSLPHLSQFEEWIIKKTEANKGKISKNTALCLAKKLGRDDYLEMREGGKVVGFIENYSLWQADNEIKKLLAKADGSEIIETDVEDLVHKEIEIDALEIANSLAENNRLKVLSMLEDFMSKESVGDAKTCIIQLSALLAEQFRNIALIQDFLQRGLKDQQILDLTLWKPGRLFMVKKAASNFSNKKVKDFLVKLQALDAELKSSSLPPRVLFDLVISQVLSTA